MDTGTQNFNSISGIDDRLIKTVYQFVSSRDVFDFIPPFDINVLKEISYFNSQINLLNNIEDKYDIKRIIALTFFLFKNYLDLPDDDYEEAYPLLMNDFIKRCEEYYKGSFLSIFKALISWKKLAAIIINDANNTYDVVFNKAIGRKIETYPLESTILWKVQLIYERYIETSNNSFFQEIKSVIPFNVWGDEYYKSLTLIHDYLPLTNEEIAMTDYSENKEYFFRRLYEELNKEVEEQEIIKKLQAIFIDYISRIHKITQKIDYLRFATEYWEDVFLTRVDLHELTEMSIMRYDGIGSYNPTLYDQCYKFITDVCNNYLKKMDERPSDLDWSSALEPLGINYDGLYKEMKNVYFTGVDYESFRKAFFAADFSELHIGAKNKGYIVSCIKQLIKTVGRLAGNEWYEAAAKTVLSDDKKCDAKRRIEKLKFESDKNRSFENILYRNITAFSKNK